MENEFIYSNHPILKNANVKVKRTRLFDLLITKFFYQKKEFFTPENLYEFFSDLQSANYGIEYANEYYVGINPDLDNYGLFSSDEQYLASMIELVPLKEIKNLNYRKAQLMISYFHEATHKSQFEELIRKLLFKENLTETDKILGISYFSEYLENATYDNQLEEIHANLNSINLFVDKMQHNRIPVNIENLVAIGDVYSFIFNQLNDAERNPISDEEIVKNHTAVVMAEYRNILKGKHKTKKIPEKILTNIDAELLKHYGFEEEVYVPSRINLNKLEEEIEQLFKNALKNVKYVYQQIINVVEPNIFIASSLGFEEDRLPTKEEWLELAKKHHPLQVINVIFSQKKYNFINARKKYFANEFDHLYKEPEL